MYTYVPISSPSEFCVQDGNPFRTFWEDQGIEFDDSEAWQNLHFNVQHTHVAEMWKKE